MNNDSGSSVSLWMATAQIDPRADPAPAVQGLPGRVYSSRLVDGEGIMAIRVVRLGTPRLDQSSPARDGALVPS